MAETAAYLVEHVIPRVPVFSGRQGANNLLLISVGTGIYKQTFSAEELLMTNPQVATPSDPQRCFVVMGFGVKTDYATGRKLDLDKTYRLLIKPVIEDKGLVCVRADEIRHSGAIDVPMYRELLTADVVIADLSTGNANALYELGIRHALRPRTTIVISETKLPYPFDLNHVAITGYTHLGDSIDYDEVLRFRKILGDTLESVLRDQKTDSPIYTFLHQLTPPALGGDAAQAVAEAGQALERAGEAIAEAATDILTAAPADEDKTLAKIIEQGEQAIREGGFAAAKVLFALALQFGKDRPDSEPITYDRYLVQRLVLATYKAKQPDELSALNEAMALLAGLAPEESNDPETVGLAGAIEKRLFDKGKGTEHLARAIDYHERGYYLRDDSYNGINLAYLLNLRADSSLDATREEKIADLVWANRFRREIVALCEKELREIEKRVGAQPNHIEADQQARGREQKFWCLATKAEAHFGLGELEAHGEMRSEAHALKQASWMMDTFDGHIGKLRVLLEKHGHLLNPPYPGSMTRLHSAERLCGASALS